MVVINGIRHGQLSRSFRRTLLLVGLILSPLISIDSTFASKNDPVVLSRVNGVTTASIMVSVPQTQAWDVLIQYEKTALKMPDIKDIKILSRKGPLIKLQQTYKAPYTFGLKIQALIEIEEKPKSMLNYRLIEGKHIRKLEGNWILIPVNGGTLVAHRIDIEPSLPGILKPLFFKSFDANLKESMVIIRREILSGAS